MVSFSCDTRSQLKRPREILQATLVRRVTETASVNFFSRKGAPNGKKTGTDIFADGALTTRKLPHLPPIQMYRNNGGNTMTTIAAQAAYTGR